MPSVVVRIKPALVLAAAALLVLGAAESRANKAAPTTGQHSNTWTTKTGVRFETRSTDWHGGKKAEWQRRITGKSGVTKINGMSWGAKVKGEARTLKNGSSLERLTYTSPTGEVRQVTIKTLSNGKIIKTIKLADESSREISLWTEKNVRYTKVIERDPQGNVTSTRTDTKDVTE